MEGGIVEEILIEEGEKVDINRTFSYLIKKKASSEYEEINSRLKSIELSIIRVEAEKNLQNSIKIPENKKQFLMKS